MFEFAGGDFGDVFKVFIGEEGEVATGLTKAQKEGEGFKTALVPAFFVYKAGYLFAHIAFEGGVDSVLFGGEGDVGYLL